MPERAYDIKNHDLGSIVGRGCSNIPVANGCGLVVEQPVDGGNRGDKIHIGLVLLYFFKNFAIKCDFVSSSVPNHTDPIADGPGKRIHHGADMGGARQTIYPSPTIERDAYNPIPSCRNHADDDPAAGRKGYYTAGRGLTGGSGGLTAEFSRFLAPVTSRILNPISLHETNYHMIRKILLVLAGLFLLIQFVRPAKNLSADTAKNIQNLYAVPADVDKILKTSCADCHSNKTIYPWYAEVQPVGWWLNNHIKEGKRHFNLDDFAGRRVNYQFKKMDDCIEQLNNGDMPLESYTLIHHNARLSAADKQTLINWCERVKSEIKSKYPADSLIMPKGRGRKN
jgi:hypothetical protein